MPCALFAIGLMLMAPFVAVKGDQPVGPDQAAVLMLVPAGKSARPTSPLLDGLLTAPAPAAAQEAEAEAVRPLVKTIKVYYVGYAPESFEALRRYVSKVDIIAGQWLSVNAAGQLTESPSAARNDEVRRIVHGAGKKVYSCVVNSGFSRSVLSGVLNSPARRAAVVNRIIAFVDRNGDDGVDLDFEGIRPGHGAGYTAFVKDLAQKLHARGKELSLAVDATWEGGPSPGFSYKQLSQYADSIMPMTYTYGPGKVPIGPINYLENAAQIASARMDPAKFMIGMGVYGRDYNLRTGRRTHPHGRDIRRILDAYAPPVAMDPDTLTKRMQYRDSNGHQHLVYFDDAETIKAKLTRLANDHQVSMVGFWRMGQEDPALWDTIEVALGRKRPAQTATATQP